MLILFEVVFVLFFFQDIESMEKLKQSNLQCQKQLVGSLVLYSVMLYIIGALLFYFYYLPDRLVDRFIYSTPLLIFPVLWVFSNYLFPSSKFGMMCGDDYILW